MPRCRAFSWTSGGARGACLLLFAALTAGLCRADPAKDQLIVETVLRLESFDYASASEKVKGSIGRYLETGRGTDEYYELVARFKIADQLPALAELASQEKAEPRAAALLVEIGGGGAIKGALAKAGGARANLLRSLGAVNDPAAVAALEALLADPAAQRSAAKALAGSPAGQSRLLELAEGGELPEQLKAGVALDLAGSADPKVRARASKALKLPAALGGGELPPVAELAEKRGDAGRGEAVYGRLCFTCHKVGDKGIDFGPALTEIGDKLAREALYTSILDPGEAISFGYEGVTIITKDGATQVGFVGSDGEGAVGLKVPGGALVSIARENIASMEGMGVSLMPAGLAAAMSEGDLVDLVEYLTTLRKP